MAGAPAFQEGPFGESMLAAEACFIVIPAHILADIQAYTQTCMHTHKHACIHTNIHTYTQTYIHAYAHTYRYINAHTYGKCECEYDLKQQH